MEKILTSFLEMTAEQLIEAYLASSYLIREVPRRPGEEAAYEVAKFMEGQEPSAVYRVTVVNGNWRCDCPGFRRVTKWNVDEHKHIKLVKAWLKKGKPSPLSKGFQAWVQSVMD